MLFGNEDCQAYLSLSQIWCREGGFEVWVYCLMINHVHLIAKPNQGSNLSRAIGSKKDKFGIVSP
ncbi:transposase [Thiolapillus sp.]